VPPVPRLLQCAFASNRGSIQPRIAGGNRMPKKRKQSSRGRKQDRARVAGGQKYEVRYEAKKTGKSKKAVKRAVKKVGNSRKKVERELRG
jgi:hypothetical protein